MDGGQWVDLPKGFCEVLSETLSYLLKAEGANPIVPVCVYTQSMEQIHTPAPLLVASTNPVCLRFHAVRWKVSCN